MTIANAEDGNATTDTWIKLAEHFETNPQLILSWVNKMEPLPEADQWVIETQRGLAKLPPASRRVVEVLIQALRKEEQRKE